ncbi:LexA family protein [Hymenobacter sp. BT491]|uniref:LexA family protein n=1 Tax=Hymenobacter sp. BT491 TaxID=2766779 RepID=UPI0016538D73|nr:translesion error-prone DNA polymerase V autoproteolytic subunit [Hymenobacter sp. BT491]MBC6992278.1 translesion error-prone DNA polymerase V autoproteolytic subunit [Hymenobacter sp. BT491]
MCEVVFLAFDRTPLWVPFIDFRIPAGFPSPAQDYEETLVDLNALLLQHPASTYLARVYGDSMDGACGIRDGCLITIDTSMKPKPGQVVVAMLEGEYTVKRLVQRGPTWWLEPDNPKYEATEIIDRENFFVRGVVTHVLTELVQGNLTSSHVRARRLQ